MGVTTNIVEDLLGPGKRALGIDHPLLCFRFGQLAGKGNGLTQWLQGMEESQFAAIECRLQCFQEEAPKQARQNADG